MKTAAETRADRAIARAPKVASGWTYEREAWLEQTVYELEAVYIDDQAVRAIWGDEAADEAKGWGTLDPREYDRRIREALKLPPHPRHDAPEAPMAAEGEDGGQDDRPEILPASRAPARDRTLFAIRMENYPAFAKRIEQLARRAFKLGLTPPVITRLRSREVEIRKGGQPTGRFYEVVDVQIIGHAPVFNGWRLCAVLDYVRSEDQAAVIVRGLPGAGDIPAAYRESPTADCQHCKTHRNRAQTFMVNHALDGWRQVGRSCLATFLGSTSPQEIADAAEMLAEIERLAGDEDDICMGGGFGRSEVFRLNTYLTVVAGLIRIHGWLSSRAADAKQTSPTYADALAVMEARPKAPRVDLHPADTELAEAAIAWAAGLEPRTDFEHNMKVLASSGTFRVRFAAMVAAILPCFNRDLIKKRERDRAIAAGAKHIGTVGERVTIRVRVIGTVRIETDFGLSILHRFADVEGNRLVWFSSGGYLSVKDKRGEPQPVKDGALHYVKATVAAHGDYNGLPQTKLKRCAVTARPTTKKPRRRKAAAKTQGDAPACPSST